MEIFLFWIGFAVVVGVIAGNRGRSGFGWFLLACIISPLLAAILVLALGTPKVDPAGDGQHKKCPACAEWVKREALKCKHCGEVFHTATPSAGARAAGAQDPVQPSAASVAFGRSMGGFFARNRTAVLVVAAVLLAWGLFRQFTP
jgi:hypothetical protein